MCFHVPVITLSSCVCATLRISNDYSTRATGGVLTLRLVSEAMKGGSSVRWFSVSERCVTFVRSDT